MAMIVWGGFDGTDVTMPGGALNDGGVYTPGTDSWATTNPMGAPQARYLHTAVWTGTAMIVWGGSAGGTGALNDGGIYAPATDSWVATALTGAPAGRLYHTAVWTGTAMIVWGGFNGPGVLSQGAFLDDGGAYTPATGGWVPTNLTGAPAARLLHTAVWTGSEMIVWGGAADWFGASLFDSGGRYTPATDSWATTSAAGAPAPRAGQTAAWTGEEMIVWGGLVTPSLDGTSTGGRYTPGTDAWVATSTTGGPGPQDGHAAVWTGSEMIVWGGFGDLGFVSDSAKYVPATDTWLLTSTQGAPTARSGHTAVWTGSEMIVWGGADATGNVDSGGRYAPATDGWVATSTTLAPEARSGHTAVWTGSEMIVWGGYDFGSDLGTGGRYAPGSDSWVATAATGAPLARSAHTAVWTGTEMDVWGGFSSDFGPLPDGFRYTPGSDSWAAMSTIGIPRARSGHAAVWTGSEMIVWGGLGSSGYLASGGRYTPATDSWAATGTTGAPAGRGNPTAVWTGSEMIVWGGGNGFDFDTNTGGRYAPGSDSWMPTSTTGAPEGRISHTAVWTGREMIVWGGENVFDSGEEQVLPNGGLYCGVPDVPPVAYPQSLVVAENGMQPITLTATDSFGDMLTYAIVASPAHGSLSGTPPAVTYLPEAGYYGPDSFTFEASDGVLDSNVAMVSLLVDATPVANPQSLVAAENVALPITLTAADPDGDALTYAIVSGPAHGALSGTAPAVVYHPAADYFGADSFTFMASDGRSDSSAATVAIVVKPAGGLFYTVAPCRLFDSRGTTGSLLAGVEKVLQAAGQCGVPAGAISLVANVTVVLPTAGGFLNLYAAPGNPPPTSVVNFAAGAVRANNAVLRLSQSGSFAALFTMSASAKADLVVDVSGYFE